MKYLLSVIDDATRTGTPEEMAAIDAFNDQLRDAGHWVFAGGLDSPTTANVIDNRSGSQIRSEGPFIASESFFSGFWIINVPNHETALERAAEGSRCCNRQVELRPFIG